MANCVTDWIFRRQRFCCCLPARLGAALLALLTLLLSGLLMVILWFEVATNYFMSDKEKVAFILAGVLETLLFIASVLGFIGTCARKQSFVAVFVTFLYVHFLVNLGVALYFLWMVTHAANQDIVKLCQEGIRNEQAEDQCKGLLNITKGVYWAISLLVLAVEAYCTIVVTRYLNQLRYEKRDVRRSRMDQRQSAYEAFHARFSSFGSDPEAEADGEKTTNNKHYSAVSRTSSEIEMDKEGLLNAPKVVPFDPYAAYEPRSHLDVRSYSPVRSEAGMRSDRSVERHRMAAERQLTGGSTDASPEQVGDRGLVGDDRAERGRSSVVSMLPPGAAPAVVPKPSTLEAPISVSSSPPPSYRV